MTSANFAKKNRHLTEKWWRQQVFLIFLSFSNFSFRPMAFAKISFMRHSFSARYCKFSFDVNVTTNVIWQTSNVKTGSLLISRNRENILKRPQAFWDVLSNAQVLSRNWGYFLKWKRWASHHVFLGHALTRLSNEKLLRHETFRISR